MLTSLMLSAALMGAAGAPHCAAMCGAPCAAAFPRGLPVSALLGRLIGYAVLGAVAAAAAGLIAELGRQVAMFKPLWLMLLMAAVLLGLWLMWTGRLPSAAETWGQGVYHRVRERVSRWPLPAGVRAGLPLLAGLLWAFMPCGLLYAALMVAVLAPTPAGGALVMACFALPSAVGVWSAPALLRWLRERAARRVTPSEPVLNAVSGAGAVVPVVWMRGDGAQATVVQTGGASRWLNPQWAIRLSGVCLAAAAGWAAAHQLWAHWQAWCA